MKKKRKKLLIIDDDESFVKVWGYILSREGYKVHVCKTPYEALVYLQNHTPSVILCDVNMPDMDGFQLSKKLRESFATQGIPMIFISAFGDQAKRKMGEECGAKGFLSKPFELQQLLSLIEGILEEEETMHSDPVCGRRMNRNRAHVVIEYKGEKYYLCCPVCQREFERNPEKYADRSKKKK